MSISRDVDGLCREVANWLLFLREGVEHEDMFSNMFQPKTEELTKMVV
jgi:hypothetical protein